MFRVGFLVLPALGCSSQSINGDLGGATPGVVEAVFVAPVGDSGQHFRVLMADFSEVCSRLSAHQEAVSAAQTQLLTAGSDDAFLAGAEAMEAADELLPEDFWLGQFEINVGSTGENLVGVSLPGSAANADIIDGFGVSFSHHSGYTDWTSCSQAWLSDPGGVDVCDYRWESWVSHGGEARVLEYVAAVELGVEFDAPFREMDVSTGDVFEEVGSLEGRVWAQWCGELQDGLRR